MTAFVTIEDLRPYINDDGGTESYSDDTLDEVIESEFSQQTAKCRQGFLMDEDVYPQDLRQAMLRRCMRALTLRGIALNAQATVDGDVRILPKSFDPEINRLEAPYRRLPVG